MDWRISLLVGGAVCGAIVACAADPEEHYVDEPAPQETPDAGFDTAPSPDSGLGILTIRPLKTYSGFDGSHTFVVPVGVYDSSSDLQLTADDPSAAEIVPKALAKPVKDDGSIDNGKWFFVTVKKAGTIKLKATSGGQTAESTLTVTAYSADRWGTGETRYKNGGSGDPPCTNCHVNGSAIDHSPAALATADDEKVGAIITTGIGPAGFPIKIDDVPGHQWKVTPEERAGLVTYLRALAPRGFK